MYSWIEIRRSALLNNYRVFKKLVAPAKVASVLKANAYGHGLVESYEVLKAEDPDWICVAYLHEAQTLRQRGYQKNLLLVTPILAKDLARAAELQLDIFLIDDAMVKAWIAEDVRPKGHLKFDTGLTRQGFYPQAAEALAETLKAYQQDLRGICTHFANVEDVLQQDFSLSQLKRFEAVREIFRAKKYQLLAHTASSASALILPQSRFDLIRLGISLYGFWPSQSTRLSFAKLNDTMIELQPVLSFKSLIASVKQVKAGEFVGYGCTFRAPAAMKVAIIPVGYAEGYARAASQGFVLVKGKRCGLLGRISMNMMLVDVTHVPDVKAEDTAVLIGRDQDDQVDAGQVAEWSGTIHYEVLTKLNSNIARRVIG